MRKKIFAFITIFFIVASLLPIGASAEPVTIDNDGQARDNPYGDSKLPASFNAPYYDCYIPYNLTPNDIGGYAVTARSSPRVVSTAEPEPMPDYQKSRKVANWVNYETSWNYMWNNWDYMRNNGIGKAITDAGATVTVEADTGLNVVTAKDGTQFYLTAVQPFFYNNSAAGSSFPSEDESPSMGQLIDIILTDGSVYHFIAADINADQHTNGGKPGLTYENSFDVFYTFAPMIKSQYFNLYSAAGNNTLEVWGTNSPHGKLKDKMNLGYEEGKNQIAYYRMYSVGIGDTWARNSGVPTTPSYSLGAVSISSDAGGNSNPSVTSLGEPITVENELLGMPSGSSLGEKAGHLKSVDGSGLTPEERYNVYGMTDKQETQRKADAWDLARQILVFAGLLILTYAILLFLGYLFDRVNTVFDISLVTLFSLGALRVANKEDIPSSDSDVGTIKGLLSERKLIAVCLILFFTGALLVSGGVLPLVMKGVNWLINQF